MTRAQSRAAKRIHAIKSLCIARAKAAEAHRRDRIKEIDSELKPLMTQQLRYELRHADEWQDFPSAAYGD